MENDLVSIYENSYLKGQVIEEKKSHKADEGDDDSAPKKKFKKGKKKFMKKKSDDNIGGITYDSFNRGESIFDKILREMEEIGGGIDAPAGDEGGDNVFDAGSDLGDEDEGGDEQSFTLSELKNMTLSELAGLIGGGSGDEFEDEGDDDFGFEGDDLDEGDEIPAESYGFSGGDGNYKGDQGNYDGKAKRLPVTTHVKGNGDAKVGETQDTGFDPDDTEGSEGANHGAQGTYDGKAKRLPPTDLVKGNGDINTGKAKTGFKTNTGKKEKNYF